jgi:signal transduction histidine kinase
MLLGSDVGDAADRGRAASVIVSEADRLSLLIDDLLSISQIETGAVQITRRPIRVEDTIEPVIVELGPLARAKSLSLRVTRQETAAEILGDEPRLRQVWTNLVHNAIKYTPSGGTIDVSVMVRDGRVIVTIADTGIGIDPRYHTRIFEMFFRVDDPAVQSQTGTGLGMPIVRELVRLHGGTISLTSNVGTGAIFRVSLPYKPAGGGKKTEAAWRAS